MMILKLTYKSFIILLFFLVQVQGCISQSTCLSKNTTVFTEDEVMEGGEDILMYECFNVITGDKEIVRKNDKGELFEGWHEDHYENGALLHQGLYKKGRLVKYENYYMNNQVEREFKSNGADKGKMKAYYFSGELKAKAKYKYGRVQMWEEFYKNGMLSMYEVYNKEGTVLEERMYNDPSGKPQMVITLINKEDSLYQVGEFNGNTSLKQAGPARFKDGNYTEWVKDGDWEFYGKGQELLLKAKFEGDDMTAVYEGDPAAVFPEMAKSLIPAEYIAADRNKDGVISVKELYAVLNDFFDEANGFSPPQITSLINYFFEQEG